VPEEKERTTTTIELKKTTRDNLRVMMVHAKVHCYDDLFNEFIMPILEKETGAKSPMKIGEAFAAMKAEQEARAEEVGRSGNPFERLQSRPCQP
jgi:hypothetical protein